MGLTRLANMLRDPWTNTVWSRTDRFGPGPETEVVHGSLNMLMACQRADSLPREHS